MRSLPRTVVVATKYRGGLAGCDRPSMGGVAVAVADAGAGAGAGAGADAGAGAGADVDADADDVAVRWVTESADVSSLAACVAHRVPWFRSCSP